MFATPRPPSPGTSGPGCLSSGVRAGVGPGPPADTRKDGAWGCPALPTPCFGSETTSACDSGHTGSCSPPSSCCGFPCSWGEAGSFLNRATMLMWHNSPAAAGQGWLRVSVRAARLGSQMGSSVVPLWIGSWGPWGTPSPTTQPNNKNGIQARLISHGKRKFTYGLHNTLGAKSQRRFWRHQLAL